MTGNPNFCVKRLEKEDLELAVALAASMCDLEHPRCEAWGIAPGRPPENAEAAWGLFIQGGLAGAAWTFTKQGATVVSAMVLPRGRWGMGLVGFMLDRIAEETGARELHIRLASGGHALGESLEDAGFAGPDILDENYPVGEWKRSRAAAASE